MMKGPFRGLPRIYRQATRPIRFLGGLTSSHPVWGGGGGEGECFVVDGGGAAVGHVKLLSRRPPLLIMLRKCEIMCITVPGCAC